MDIDQKGPKASRAQLLHTHTQGTTSSYSPQDLQPAFAVQTALGFRNH